MDIEKNVGRSMTKEQELKLYGFVLPEKVAVVPDIINLSKSIGINTHSLSLKELESLLELVRTQREAISALIEICNKFHSGFPKNTKYTEQYQTEFERGFKKQLQAILSVVLQDTWSGVREAWEE